MEKEQTLHKVRRRGANANRPLLYKQLRDNAYGVRAPDTQPLAIENRLQWMLDVNFLEDASKAKKDNSPLNLSVLRKIALSLLRNAATSKKVSLRRKKLRAAFNPDFLQLVLLGG